PAASAKARANSRLSEWPASERSWGGLPEVLQETVLQRGGGDVELQPTVGHVEGEDVPDHLSVFGGGHSDGDARPVVGGLHLARGSPRPEFAECGQFRLGEGFLIGSDGDTHRVIERTADLLHPALADDPATVEQRDPVTTGCDVACVM